MHGGGDDHWLGSTWDAGDARRWMEVASVRWPVAAAVRAFLPFPCAGLNSRVERQSGIFPNAICSQWLFFLLASSFVSEPAGSAGSPGA